MNIKAIRSSHILKRGLDTLYVLSLLLFFILPSSELFAREQKVIVNSCLPKPDIRVSTDGKLLLIRLSNGIQVIIDDITYIRSGLYRTDGSGEPVWILNNDFRVLALTNDGTFAAGSIDATNEDLYARQDDVRFNTGAMKFYKNGKQLKRYDVLELVGNPRKIPTRTDISRYPWTRNSKFDQKNNLFYLETVDHNLYVFDITTGEMLGAKRSNDHERESGEQPGISYPKIGPEHLEYYNRNENKGDNWSTMPDDGFEYSPVENAQLEGLC